MKALSALLSGLAACAFLGACEFGSAPGADKLPPRIAYSAPLGDTVGVPAVHDVLSTGGSIGLFRIVPAPPAGLALDSLTGRISGTPATAYGPRDYSVIATGPFGSDTAVLRLWAVAPYDPGLAPSVAYASPSVDTVGTAASHAAYSLGGPVTSYALLTPLPAGFTLNASTGWISGTPSAAFAWTDYRVVATGPGGKDTATLRLAAVAGPAQQSPSQKPSIAYDSPAYDTVGQPASHPALSLGGKVTSYAVISVDGSPDSLPAGLSLNTTTGLISGTPQIPDDIVVINYLAAKRADMIWPPTGYQSIAYPYHIVATGPGGKDTAALAIVVTWRTGEAPEPLPVAGIYLGVQLENKGSATSLKKMVVTWTSNVSTDAVVRDTILPGTAGFTASGSQAFSKHYALKPLRHWGLTVKTLDALDSVRHFDSIVSLSLLAGEARVVNVNLARHYHTWNVKISLPDSLGIAGSLFKESLRVHRVRVLLDGVPVRDTIKSAGYFASAPTTHAMEYDYVRPGARAWKVEVYGDLPGWSSSLPLFAGTLTTGCAACGSSDQVSLVWMGPGSPSDPNSGSGSPIVIAPMPSVSISKVNSVIAADDFGPGGPLPKR